MLDLNLDLDAASVEPYGRGRDLRGGQSAQAGTSHPMSVAARPWPSRAGSVGKAAGAAPGPSLSWALPATLLATGHSAGLRPSAAQPQPARPYPGPRNTGKAGRRRSARNGPDQRSKPSRETPSGRLPITRPAAGLEPVRG